MTSTVGVNVFPGYCFKGPSLSRGTGAILGSGVGGRVATIHPPAHRKTRSDLVTTRARPEAASSQVTRGLGCDDQSPKRLLASISHGNDDRAPVLPKTLIRQGLIISRINYLWPNPVMFPKNEMFCNHPEIFPLPQLF